MSYLSERPEWPTRPEPTAGFGDAWRCVDNMAMELEVLDLLFGLVRCWKPARVFETGTGRGLSTLAIASALAENRDGHVTSFESQPRFAREATERLRDLPAEVVEWPRPVTADATLRYGVPDAVLLDSGRPYRPTEIEHWLGEPVLLIVHDSKRYALPADGTALATPRGLWYRDRRAD